MGYSRMVRKMKVIDFCRKVIRKSREPLIVSPGFRFLVLLIVAGLLFILMALIISLSITSMVSEARVEAKNELLIYPRIIEGSIHRKASSVNNIPVEVTFFSTRDSAQEVIRFYRESLVAQGWEVLYPLSPEEMEAKGLKIPQAPQPRLENIQFLVLQKKDWNYWVAVRKEGEKNIVTTRQVRGEIEYGTRIKDASGEEPASIPRYPGAIRRVCIQNPAMSNNGLMLYYESQASPTAIVTFYKRELKNKGWKSVSLPQGKNAPACIIVFQNKRGESCMLSISQDKEKISSQILILYNKKKGF